MGMKFELLILLVSNIMGENNFVHSETDIFIDNVEIIKLKTDSEETIIIEKKEANPISSEEDIEDEPKIQNFADFKKFYLSYSEKITKDKDMTLQEEVDASLNGIESIINSVFNLKTKGIDPRLLFSDSLRQFVSFIYTDDITQRFSMIKHIPYFIRNLDYWFDIAFLGLQNNPDLATLVNQHVNPYVTHHHNVTENFTFYSPRDFVYKIFYGTIEESLGFF